VKKEKCVCLAIFVILALFLGSSHPVLYAYDSAKNGAAFSTQEDDIESTISKAVTELKKGKSEKAIYLLSEAIFLIKNEQKLDIKQIILCNAINGFRDYIRYTGYKLSRHMPLLLYIEPKGYQIQKERGKYKIWISEDAKIRDERGKVIFLKQNWVNYKKTHGTPHIPFYITNRVKDIPPGNYTFECTIRDHYGNTSFTEVFLFEVE
jgi:hypothetical protein